MLWCQVNLWKSSGLLLIQSNILFHRDHLYRRPHWAEFHIETYIHVLKEHVHKDQLLYKYKDQLLASLERSVITGFTVHITTCTVVEKCMKLEFSKWFKGYQWLCKHWLESTPIIPSQRGVHKRWVKCLTTSPSWTKQSKQNNQGVYSINSGFVCRFSS